MKKKCLKFIFVVVSIIISVKISAEKNAYIVETYPTIICLDSLGNVKWKKSIYRYRGGWGQLRVRVDFPYVKIENTEWIDYLDINTGEIVCREKNPSFDAFLKYVFNSDRRRYEEARRSDSLSLIETKEREKGFLLIRTIPKYIVCIDCEGNIKWKKPNVDDYWFIASNGGVDILESEFYFAGYDKKSGSLLWKQTNFLGKRELRRYTSIEKSYLQVTSENALMVLNIQNGKIILKKIFSPGSLLRMWIENNKIVVKFKDGEKKFDIKEEEM